MSKLRFIVYLTTFSLVIYTILSQLTVPAPLIFSGFILCSGLMFYMIVSILKSPYKTNKTFSDWYEDKNV
jgi:hypothetical protein